MEKKKDYKVLSGKKCACGCGRFLKQNLLDKNPDAEFIFRHFPRSKKNRPNADPKKYRRKPVMAVENNVPLYKQILK